MSRYFLAIDIGASSGRHILGSVENGKIVLEEVYRFWNGMDHVDGTLCWDVDRLFNEIIAGMKKCKEIGKIPVSVGIDTWGVDFVLLDKEDNIVGQTVGYRDHRTEGMDEEVYKIISEDDLYARTGIQKAIYNTIYQLMAVKKTHPEYLEKADAMLMIPDYFHFKLSGKKVQEYSEATTSQLINPVTKDWDYELIDMLGFPRGIFQKVLMPGTTIGNLTDEVRELVGYDCKVVLPPTHDTASAVMAIPTNAEDTCYISSGTWSLMGVEMAEANCSPKSKEANFTNEGGTGGNVGIQSSAIVVQGLANGSLDLRKSLSQIVKELGLALINASIISLLVFAYNFFIFHPDFKITIAVSASLFAVVLFAATFGTFVPLTLEKMKVDPAIATGPFITITNDIIGMMIYMTVCMMLLQ